MNRLMVPRIYILFPGHFSRFMRSGRSTTVSIWRLFVGKQHPRIIKENRKQKTK